MVWCGGCTGVLALLLPGGQAQAQAQAQATRSIADSSVAGRARPEYAPIGGRIGSFFVYPDFDLKVVATDNVRATQSARVDDVEVALGARVSVVSNFSRHALVMSANYAETLHLQLPSEDAARYGAKVDGRYDIDSGTWLALSASAEHAYEPRSSYNSPDGAARPGRFDQLGATLQAERNAARLTLGAGGGVTSFRYADVSLMDGGALSQRFRDVNIAMANLLVGYEFRPGLRAIARATGTWTDYVLATGSALQPRALDRDSRGVRLEGGFRFELTSLLQGEVRAGYLRRNYAAPALRDASGPSYGVDLMWNATPLTSLRIRGERRIDEAASLVIAGNRVTEAGIGVDHELRRNLILSGATRYAWLRPLGPESSSREFDAEAGTRWLINRRVSASVTYRHARRSSPIEANAFAENRIGVSVRLTL